MVYRATMMIYNVIVCITIISIVGVCSSEETEGDFARNETNIHRLDCKYQNASGFETGQSVTLYTKESLKDLSEQFDDLQKDNVEAVRFRFNVLQKQNGTHESSGIEVLPVMVWIHDDFGNVFATATKSLQLPEFYQRLRRRFKGMTIDIMNTTNLGDIIDLSEDCKTHLTVQFLSRFIIPSSIRKRESNSICLFSQYDKIYCYDTFENQSENPTLHTLEKSHYLLTESDMVTLFLAHMLLLGVIIVIGIFYFRLCLPHTRTALLIPDGEYIPIGIKNLYQFVFTNNSLTKSSCIRTRKIIVRVSVIIGLVMYCLFALLMRSKYKNVYHRELIWKNFVLDVQLPTDVLFFSWFVDIQGFVIILCLQLFLLIIILLLIFIRKGVTWNQVRNWGEQNKKGSEIIAYIITLPIYVHVMIGSIMFFKILKEIVSNLSFSTYTALIIFVTILYMVYIYNEFVNFYQDLKHATFKVIGNSDLFVGDNANFVVDLKNYSKEHRKVFFKTVKSHKAILFKNVPLKEDYVFYDYISKSFFTYLCNEIRPVLKRAGFTLLMLLVPSSAMLIYAVLGLKFGWYDLSAFISFLVISASVIPRIHHLHHKLRLPKENNPEERRLEDKILHFTKKYMERVNNGNHEVNSGMINDDVEVHTGDQLDNEPEETTPDTIIWFEDDRENITMTVYRESSI